VRTAAASAPLVLSFLLLFLPGCESEPPAPEPITVQADTSATSDTTVTTRFVRYPLTGASALEELIDRVGMEDYATILRLNRIDPGYARQGDTLITPVPVPPLEELSTFPPELPGLHEIPKLLLVSLRIQAWAAYEYGLLAHWGPASTGKRSTPTCAGLFYTNWKAAQRASSVNADWILKWSFNFDNFGGCSIHLYDLPGRPASHSCVRALEDDARWIYEWADQWILTADEEVVLRNGTPLVIFGEYDFDSPPPWKRLPEEPDVLDISLDEIEVEIDSLTSPYQLASLSPDGLEIEVRIDGMTEDFRLDDLEGELSQRGDIRLVRYDFMMEKLRLLAPLQTRMDFDSLRVFLKNAGITPGRMYVEGLGKAQRVGGIASMVAADGDILFLLESMHVPGMGYRRPVEFRFRGLISARSERDDPAAPFRLILSLVERTRPEEEGGPPLAQADEEEVAAAAGSPADTTSSMD
jgi:hypothetical protein